jgi:NAD(P)-dependent dehydrogenase (short-subunit alcohol dehydrogenase family)
MIESSRGGVILNISSISRVGNVGQTNYAAARAGVAVMTVIWAKELARYKIRVAGIAPGLRARPRQWLGHPFMTPLSWACDAELRGRLVADPALLKQA